MQRPAKQPTHRRFAPIVLMVLLLPACLLANAVFAPDWTGLAERAALTSVMASMPEGSLALLERRFSDKQQDSYYESSEQEVAPYMSPWPQTPLPTPDASESASSAPGTAPPPAASKRPTQPVVPAAPAQTALSKEIPEKFRGTVVQENMTGTTGNLIAAGLGKLRNYTETTDEEIRTILDRGLNIQLEKTDAPQVLIVHTHATESYEPYDSEIFDTRNTWRDTDNTKNMTAVGDRLAQTLRAQGIGVLHDKTQHDHPSYTGAYERSAETVRRYLEAYPTIKVVLDVHRDAILRADDLIVKPTVEVGGKKAAQLMIITGCEDGTMNVPRWKENLQFAGALQDSLEQVAPQITRPIFFCYRKYNMDLTTGSLLLEFGSNANTLDESLYTAELVGKALGGLLLEGAGNQ